MQYIVIIVPRGPSAHFPFEEDLMTTWRSLFLVFAAVSCLAGYALAGTQPRLGLRMALRENVIPAEWGGIWNVEDATYDCDTNQLLGTDAYADTLCAGATIEFGSDEFVLTCSGTADGNAVSVNCTGSFPIIEDCVLEYTTQFTATRTGDTYVSTMTSSMDYVGAGCLFLPDQCTRTESTATRVGPEPIPCGLTPVESVNWGTLKSLYR
jgi:hypothetical protein